MPPIYDYAHARDFSTEADPLAAMRAQAARLKAQFYAGQPEPPEPRIQPVRSVEIKAAAKVVAVPVAQVKTRTVRRPARVPVDRDAIVEMARAGKSTKQITAVIGCAERTVSKAVKLARDAGVLPPRAGQEPPPPRDILHLKTIPMPLPGSRSRARAIVGEMAAAENITVAELMGPRRDRTVSSLRQRAMARVYVDCTELGLSDIGRLFHRDHTTVLHALRKMGVHGART